MVEFDIAEPTSVHVFILYDDQCNPTCATSGPMDNFGMIYSSNGTTFVFAINNGQTQQDFDRILPPGHYNLLVYYEQGFNTTISAHWQIKVPVLQKKGGGIRLKAIRSFDGIGVTKVKKFDYTAGGKSSGRLINNPLYSYYFDQGQSVHMDQGGSSFGCEYVGTYITRQSNAVLTTGLSGGGAVVGYDKVTVLEGENGEGGRTEHYFYNAAGSYDVNAFPSTPIYISPFNGKESTEIVYDAAGNKVSRKDYTYTFNEYATLKGLKIFAGMLTTDGSFLVKFFDNPSYWVVPVAETDVLYANGDSSVTSKNYYFNNPGNRELSRMEASMSDGRTSITKYKRPDDYPSAGTSSFAAQMVAQHILSPVVEQQTLITDASSTKLVSGSFTSYAPYNGAVYKPNVVYRLELTGPSADTTASAISGAGAVSYHSAYQPALYFDQYDGASNLVATHKMDEINQAYIWDYHSAYPIAQIEHAALQDVAYTSFEADGSGGWIIGSGSRDAGGVTGVECYNLAGGACNKSGLTAATTYIVSYWSKTLNSYNVSGSTGFKQGKTVVLDGVSWAYFEHVVTGVSAVSVSGSGDIDELRLYPADARMNTYTYIPLVGMSSSCDVSNRVTYYEYDGLPRLVRIRDMDKNILKQYDYQYQYPAKFYNIAESGAFTTSCTGGGVPSQIV
jgi:hypothetical protein